jgi:threonine 3-dehydrogenase
MTMKMRALVKKTAAPGLTLTMVEKPLIGPKEVLMRVKQASICGTDLHIYNWDAWAAKTITPPLTIGHEFMGTIEEIGSAVDGYKKGQRVVCEGHITCGHCVNCRTDKKHLCINVLGTGIHKNGAFAEFVAVPAENLFVLPDSISDDIATIYDPLGNATHTALSFDLVGKDVLITGAGPIGLMAIAIAKKVGAGRVIIADVRETRLKLALKMGADRAVNISKEKIPDVLHELGIEHGVNVGLEMSGNGEALNSMISNMIPGGEIALLGIFPQSVTVNFNDVIFKGLSLKGIYGREMFKTWETMTHLLEQGLDVSPIITHRIDLEDFETGFAALKTGEAGKVVFRIG